LTKANMAAAGEPAPNSHVIGRRRPARPGERIPPARVRPLDRSRAERRGNSGHFQSLT
jgi:hypothetical protein